MRITFTGAGPTTSASFHVTDPGSHWQSQNWTLYVTGTPGASGSVQIQISPDMWELPDASSRWINLLTTPVTTTPNQQTFTCRFRKVRYAFTGGDATTNLVVEIV